MGITQNALGISLVRLRSHAVMAMADLAVYEDNGPTSLTDISLRQNISLPYLEQIFIKLKNKFGYFKKFNLQIPLMK